MYKRNPNSNEEKGEILSRKFRSNFTGLTIYGSRFAFIAPPRRHRRLPQTPKPPPSLAPPPRTAANQLWLGLSLDSQRRCVALPLTLPEVIARRRGVRRCGQISTWGITEVGGRASNQQDIFSGGCKTSAPFRQPDADSGPHEHPHQQIWHHTVHSDLWWDSQTYLSTVTCVFVCTVTLASKGYKYRDQTCILLRTLLPNFLEIRWRA
jgi:hypothetical protein